MEEELLETFFRSLMLLANWSDLEIRRIVNMINRRIKGRKIIYDGKNIIDSRTGKILAVR